MPKGEIRNQFLPVEIQVQFHALASVTWNETTAQFSREVLTQAALEYDVLITGWGTPKMDASVLPAHPRLKLILHTGGTLAPYVDDTTFQAGIRVASSNHIYARSVAEGTLAYLLAGLRQIPYWDARTKQGLWRPDHFVNQGLFDKKVGIIGFGAITKQLIPMLQLFTSDIAIHSQHASEAELNRYQVKQDSLTAIFDRCDVVIIQTSLTPQTAGMITSDLLDRLKPNCLLVNTARGEIIDEAYLYQCLKAQRFSAVLDVYGEEPVPKSNPFVGLNHVITMPHQAGPTQDQYRKVGELLVKQLQAYQAKGELLDEVLPEAISHMSKK